MRAWGDRLRIEWIDGTQHSKPAIRVTGAPKGEPIDRERIAAHVLRACPGHSPWTSGKRTAEAVEILKGVRGDRLSGGEILITLSDSRPGTKAAWQGIPRPGHADLAAYDKWGLSADLSEAGPYGIHRMTLLAAAGSIALQLLEDRGVTVGAHIASIGLLRDHLFDPMEVEEDTLQRLRGRAFPVLEETRGMQMIQRILREKAAGNSVGGTVEACAIGLPKGLGGPWFSGLESRIAAGLYALPALKGVEFGSGFGAAALTGSQHNDPIRATDMGIGLASNRAGGILGGLSTGLPLILRCAFKPTPTIALEQETVDVVTGEKVILLGRVEDENRPRGRHEKPLEPVPEAEETRPGRHEAPEEAVQENVGDGYVDLRTGETVRLMEVGGNLEPCVVPRAVPLVESIIALALLDAMLQDKES